MASVSLDPYLFFNGNAKEAMEFYKNVFGGDLSITTFGEAMPDNPEMKDKIMHAMLSGGDVKIMASDGSKASEKTAKIELSLSGDDEQKLKGYYEKLSAEGKVKSALKKEAWGDQFGQFQDKYGVDWMVNISTPNR
jgi:PhnB protein